MRTRSLARAAAVAFIPLLAGCAEKAAQGDDSASNAAPPAVAAPLPFEVAVTAKNYTFDGLPDTLAAGPTTIRLTNGGPMPELHHVNVVRIDDGHTSKEFLAELASGKMPAWAKEAGGPNVNSIPGEISSATIDLTPGSYVVLCFVPGPDGVPHFAKGMSKDLTVIPATGAAAAMPAADVEIKLADYSFTVAPAFTAGRHVVKVTTAEGTQPHEVIIVRLEAGRTPADVIAFIEGAKGPPPAAFVAGISGMSSTFVNTFEANLTPGEYALICVLPDAKDGKMHAHHGMTQVFTVK